MSDIIVSLIRLVGQNNQEWEIPCATQDVNNKDGAYCDTIITLPNGKKFLFHQEKRELFEHLNENYDTNKITVFHEFI
jgi:uncharacterized protein YlzI (FlbEa/FlbD family)